ncbi:MAG TPA: hypothetical protein VG815_05545 [Chloroflexota bacterium]|jgi:hypothetical protein|nr:hypothetical protein [Chloroflexota bacterium]
MANASFKANSAAFKEMAVGPEVTAIVTEIAARGLEIAQGLSEPFAKTHDYATSFNVRTAVVILRTGFGSHPVVAGILENTSDHAAAVEWGNKKDSRSHHVLGRTLEELESA